MSAVATTIAATPARRMWQTSPLGKVVTFLGGGTPSKQRDGFWGGEIPWVSPKDMKADVVAGSIDNITPAAVAGSAVKLIPAGALLIVVRSGILARTIPTALAGATLTINQDLKALVPSAVLDAHFLAYFMRSVESRLLEQVSRGATVHRLETGALRSLAIPLPPLEEQKRIVAVLDQAFAALDRARANAEANLVDARELYDAGLRDMLQSVAHSKPEQTLMGIVEAIVDCEHKTAPLADQGYPSIRTPNVGKGILNLDGVNRVSEETYLAWTRRATPEPGDLIMAREAPAGNVAVIPPAMKVCLGQRTLLIKPNRDTTEPAFLAALLLHPLLQARLLAKSSGATVAHVNMSDIRLLPMPHLPDLQRQKACVRKLAALHTKATWVMDAAQQKLANLAALRQSLLQKAFAGELT